MTNLKLLKGPRSNGFSPGFVCNIARVLISFSRVLEVFDGLENEMVRNPGDSCRCFGTYTASVQTMVFLDRFSIVVELMMTN